VHPFCPRCPRRSGNCRALPRIIASFDRGTRPARL